MNIKKTQLLFGHTSKETAKEVKDYPWGYKLKTSHFYWVETNKKGSRLCTYTIDPRNGRDCKPKLDVYHTYVCLYVNDEGHIKHRPFTFNCLLTELRGKIAKFLELIPIEQITQQQQENVRKEIISCVAIGAPYEAREYSAELLPTFQQWAKNAVAYLMRCEFKDLAGFAPMPEPDIKD